tara:strand:- start:1076 stop:1276 length:201 start_codon:yes stop_codon:yes gene_type:complete
MKKLIILFAGLAFFIGCSIPPGAAGMQYTCTTKRAEEDKTKVHWKETGRWILKDTPTWECRWVKAR